MVSPKISWRAPRTPRRFFSSQYSCWFFLRLPGALGGIRVGFFPSFGNAQISKYIIYFYFTFCHCSSGYRFCIADPSLFPFLRLFFPSCFFSARRVRLSSLALHRHGSLIVDWLIDLTRRFWTPWIKKQRLRTTCFCTAFYLVIRLKSVCSLD